MRRRKFNLGPAQLARVLGWRLYKGNICRPLLLRGSVSWWLTARVAITQSRADECPGQPSARGTPRSAIPFVSVRPVSPGARGSRGQPSLSNSFFFFFSFSTAHVSSHIRTFTLFLFLPRLPLWRSAEPWTSSHPATCCYAFLTLFVIPPGHSCFISCCLLRNKHGATEEFNQDQHWVAARATAGRRMFVDGPFLKH